MLITNVVLTHLEPLNVRPSTYLTSRDMVSFVGADFMCCNTMFLQSSSAYSQIRRSCMHHAMHRWTRCTRVAGSFRIKHKGSILRVMKPRHEQVKHVHKCCAQLTWRHEVPSPTRGTARRSIHEANTDACKLALLTYSGKSLRRAALSVKRANITNVSVRRE